jgi:HK97 family phage portal protein
MWLSGYRASGEDRSPWGPFWFEPVTSRTSSGARVSNDTAMRLTAVYRAVRLLSETKASLPFGLFRKGDYTPVTDHWLYRLFAQRPNRWQNPFEWREMVQGHVVHRGNAFNRIHANGKGEIEELVPIHPDYVRVELLDNGSYRYLVRDRMSAREEPVERGDMWHLRGLSSDGIMGLNPIEISREALGLGLSAQEYGSRFFSNDGTPVGGWIEVPFKFKDEEAKKSFRESWKAARTGRKRFETAVLEQGMKYHQVQLNNRDAQFLEARQFGVAEIARIYGVPPHMIGDLSKSTNNNIEQQSLEFVIYTMTPWASRWRTAIESDLLLDDDGLEVRFDFANLLRGDSKARSAYYHYGITDGWLVRNEARRSENLAPIDGLDEPLRPLNMAPESEADALLEADDAGAGERPDDETPTDQEEEDPSSKKKKPAGARIRSRLARLAGAAAERIARKETLEVQQAMRKPDSVAALVEVYEKHAAFIAQALEVSEASAKHYCTRRFLFARAAAESKDVDVEIFTDTAKVLLMKLALKGSR